MLLVGLVCFHCNALWCKCMLYGNARTPRHPPLPSLGPRRPLFPSCHRTPPPARPTPHTPNSARPPPSDLSDKQRQGVSVALDDVSADRDGSGLRTVGGYVILELLGKGAFGAVYKARK